MIDFDDIDKCGLEDGTELKEMAVEAKNYLMSWSWCTSVNKISLHCGWGGVLAVFYAEISPLKNAYPDYWVIVAEGPPAYLDLGYCPTGLSAVETYVYLLREWSVAVRNGQSVAELMPLEMRGSRVHKLVPETVEMANMIDSRLQFVESDIIPEYSEMFVGEG